MSFELRVFERSDMDAVMEFCRARDAELGLKFKSSSTRQWLLGILEEVAEGSVLQLYAWAGHEAVGECTLVRYQDEQSHLGELSLFVHPAWRHVGIGEQLVRGMLERAATSGFEQITLWVRHGNKASLSLFEKLSFETFGVLDKAFKGPGGYESCVFMRKNLT